MKRCCFFVGMWLTLILGTDAAYAASAAPGTTSQTILVGGMKRTYLLHAPPSVSPDRPVPLVIALHGGKGTGRAMEKLTNFSPLADREGFIVIYPDASGDNWNDGRAFPASTAYASNIDDVAAISAMIDDVGKRYALDKRRIYATGISNGGIMTNYLALKMPDRLAAIASVAGGIADQVARPINPGNPISVLIMNGTKDPIVPYKGGNVAGKNRGATIGTEQMAQLWTSSDRIRVAPNTGTLPDVNKSDGCTVNWESWKGPGNSEVRLMTLNGAGHTWPGGSQYLPKFLIGGVCRDFDATQLIWQFFKDHPKP